MLKRFVLPAAVAAVLAMPSLGLAQQPSKLRFASFIPDGISTTGVFMPFIESVNKQSKGTLQIEFFGNGALGRNPMQQPQMVLDGVADLAWVILPQTRGRFRETEVLELPTLFKDVTDCTSVASRLQVRNKFGGFDDFYVVGIVRRLRRFSQDARRARLPSERFVQLMSSRNEPRPRSTAGVRNSAAET